MSNGNAFVFPACDLTGLRQSLLAFAPNEAAAVLLAGRSQTPQVRLLAREVHVVPTEACITQEPLRVEIKPEFLAPLMKRARNEGWSMILAHTHPFADAPVRFSTYDDGGEELSFPAIFSRAADRPHGSLVLGRSGFDARLRERPMMPATSVDELIEVGHQRKVHDRHAQATDIATEFDRNVRAFGAQGQAALQKLTIAIVGLGGLGSIVAEYLAHLGVGSIILLEPDVVERTNLNRLVGADPTVVGVPKVEVAARNIRRIRPSTSVTPTQGTVLTARDGRCLLSADFIFCCTDSHGSRAVLNQLAYQYFIPTVDIGVVIKASAGRVSHVTGRVQMLAPGLACLVCQNFLDSEEVRRDFLTDAERARDPYIIGGEAEPQPAVISLNGVMASLGVTMMLAATTGFPSPARHQLFVGERGVLRVVESQPDPNCVVCSRRGAFGRGDLWPLPWRPQ